MLSDILATIIAFISVILLLSIVVTSLVQISQALLRLRGRNLMKALAALLVNARVTGEEEINLTPADKKQARIDATKIMNAPNVALTDRVEKPESWLRYWVAGPNVSWIEPDDLADAIDLADVKTGCRSREELADDFRKSETHMKRRFLRMTRGWSVAWAVIVAFAFQISAPALFNDLASESERRDQIVADAENLLTYHTESIANVDHNLLAPRALERLAQRHEEHRLAIEEAAGVGTTRAFVLEELELALEDVPERDALVAEYDELMDEVADELVEENSENLKYAVAQLRQYQIAFWPRGAAYYRSQEGAFRWANIVGVLITAILLSFGGAFWFEQLRNVLSLRDRLAGKSGRRVENGNGADQSVPVLINVGSGDAVVTAPATLNPETGGNSGVDRDK
jgi:hypothetical protein